MDNKILKDNASYLIRPPKDWFDQKIIFPNGGILTSDNIIGAESYSKDDCYIKLVVKNRSWSYEATPGMKELLAFRGFKHLLSGAMKTKTKPKGSNPRIVERNKQIQKEYYDLHYKEGYTATKAYGMLSEKHDLSTETIKSYVK